MQIQEIFVLYEEKLRRVEETITNLLNNVVPFIPLVGSHILSSGGKRLRPLFHLMSADMAGYKGNFQIDVAAIVEMIHTASLLHDDVVDQADTRRGQPTANSRWGNEIVVLVGDYLYSNALKAAVMLKNQSIMETLSAATTKMTEGELLQLNRIGDPNLQEEEYLSIISSKTGALISAACRTGAILGNLPFEQEQALADFGMKTGIAFQMADDILDYNADEKELGKKLCKDLEEGKITLPLLYLMEKAEESEVKQTKLTIQSDLSPEGISRILDLLRNYDAIEQSFQKAHVLIGEAKRALDIFPDSPSKEALFAIADYSLVREK